MALSLYRAALRRARRCPDPQQCLLMQKWTRNRFEDNRDITEPYKVQALLRNGWDEIKQMDAYQDAYRARVGESADVSRAQHKPVRDWEVEDVAEWFEEDKQLKSFASTVRELDVDGALFAALDEDGLQELVPSAIARKRLQLRMKKLTF